MHVILIVSRSLPLTRKEHDEEYRGNKDVHADRVQIAHPSAGNIFPREETRPDDEILHSHKKLTVEMGDIFKKVPDQVANGLFRLKVLLPAPRTKPLFHGRATIQAGLVMTKMMGAHGFSFKSIEKSVRPAAPPYI
jgi:hypothetical protein